MKLKCLIVDDEPNAVLLLESYIKRLPYLSLQKSCYNGIEVLDFLKNNAVDLILLDINMPMLNGMDLSSTISDQVGIIFTTAYSEYAVESYERNAIDYLLKPITFVRFQKALSLLNTEKPQINQTTSESVDWLYIKSGTEFIRIEFDDILFVKGEREYISIHTISKKHLIYKRMKEIENQLPSNFCRVHQSFIVNLTKIDKVIQNNITIGKAHIPISQSYKAAFLKRIEKYLL
ncbi:LytR/AlgR family response regulator transcription factor [Chondrinema litorale]|uniref:LytR/AlgR family response regulator transcription factor n=1 Tax=Chondrinema litorale TaxID=2994555 RepID=UPI002542F1A0|nr:LytTR family DNA-binding domain-containing protein [Chondrinema litorale]UZR96530.1 LytTR family DNA-binding domain-containing protein [Chondrinema litorale]